MAKQPKPHPITLLQHQKRKNKLRQSVTRELKHPSQLLLPIILQIHGRKSHCSVFTHYLTSRTERSGPVCIGGDAEGAFSLALALQARSACTELGFSVHTG